ncbi:MOSC domain-containing protein [Aliikangiella marina]|uniref:MOSC domain-containing protein n=1 Tax=Aliikangiella marina TaxID=1712262 RepID=A0A545TBV6_9GAMM|nr:MOSC domain-containing protein [Aliikangiella marina]TQV74703.1 MOSC domain-containing protein [Aliikangiella marina]
MKLSEIVIHPIKSLAGISVNVAHTTPLGLANDRMMMLVDEHGKFITQRVHSKLALLEVSLSNQELTVSYDGVAPLAITQAMFTDQEKTVEIWGDMCQAKVAPASVNQWFSQYLGFRVSLVSYQQSKPRPVDPNYAQADDNVSFADGFPLLVISQGSLDDLNTRLSTPVTMKSFRPNIVVEGCPPYAEDSWKQIKVGEVIFDAVKLCSRCILTTVDPQTGVKREDKEPLKTLSQYRRQAGGVMFGMNLIPRTNGEIRLDDKVEVLA